MNANPMEVNASLHPKQIYVEDDPETRDEPRPGGSLKRDATFRREIRNDSVFSATVSNSV